MSAENLNEGCGTMCAVHSVVIEHLQHDIESLAAGQAEMKDLIQSNHHETLDNIKYMTTEYRQSLERVHNRLDAEVKCLREENYKLNEKIHRLNVKLSWFVGGAAVLGPAATIIMRLVGV